MKKYSHPFSGSERGNRCFLSLPQISKVSFLIADSGSTKADWHFSSETNFVSFQTNGVNPYFFTSTSLAKAILRDVLPQLNGELPEEIIFYGAGCAAADRKIIVRDALKTVFQKSEIEVHDDLLGAARGLLKKDSGFIAILGTGMNNGLYDGKKITHHIDSLGFILGDEGSGTAIGKKILKAFLRSEFPPVLQAEFESTYKLSRDDIIRSVYSGTEVNRFIGEFTRFAVDRQSNEVIRELIRNSFEEFFQKIVSRFPSYQTYSFNCIGSVGFHFLSILNEVVFQFGMKSGKILQSPMKGLTEFHSSNLKS